MIYVLEFFHFPNGDRSRVQIAEKRRIKTKDQAVSYVRAGLDNVVIDGLRPDVCLIKDQEDALICEVKRDANQKSI